MTQKKKETRVIHLALSSVPKNPEDLSKLLSAPDNFVVRVHDLPIVFF